jgi:competence protein ComEC
VKAGGPPEVEVLAVGHGLAVVVDTGGGRAVLYDCGRMRDPSVGRRVVAPALWSRGVVRLDHVVISHADADHYDGLLDVADRFPVGDVLVPAGFAEGSMNPGAGELVRSLVARGVTVREVAAGETWGGGAARFEVLHPAEGWEPRATDNARSLVLDVSWSGRHSLLTGDLDSSGLFALAARPRPEPLDLFLAPHHGGRTANPPWLYRWAGPSLVVVSQRPPQAGTRDAMTSVEAAGSRVLRTWEEGAVRLRWSGSGFEATGFTASRSGGGHVKPNLWAVHGQLSGGR